ncbi:MAG: hypothetical protein ACXWZL_06505 [Mycobacterium sp.]
MAVLARASTDNAPPTLAAARDAVFRRYLPMAHTLATTPGPGSRPVDPADAERAAELGSARAVPGWRRPGGAGFEVIAHAAIAAQLRRLPAASPGNRPGPGDRQSTGPDLKRSSPHPLGAAGDGSRPRGIRSTEGRR